MPFIPKSLKNSPLPDLLAELAGGHSPTPAAWADTVTAEQALEFAKELTACAAAADIHSQNAAAAYQCIELYFTAVYGQPNEKEFSALIGNIQTLCREKINPAISLICDPVKKTVHVREYKRKQSQTAPQAQPHKQHNGKKTVYTCITGGYDALIQHTWQAEDWDYCCFTDNEEYLKQKTVGHWRILPLHFKTENKQLTGRWHKTHPHLILPNSEQSLYIDGNINILSPYLFEIIEEKQKYFSMEQAEQFVLGQFVHPVRDCIYEEILACLRGQKESRQKLENVKNLLTEKHFPPHWGLSETGVLYRKHHTPLCIKLMEEWWHMLEHYSVRDQVSLMYILWKNKQQPEWLCPYAYRTLKHDFAVIAHKKTITIR